ncbi:Hypothetical protein RY67_93 [Bifidobacterium longum subsp. infantis]|uniref:Uncharacterized protein n=1 Tax=Bifidobacterium longum subsp. infantis TaxID=1682 RepID=A0A0M4LPN4_BIFLI|nr:Hypothetical protein RY67_93 [Bifidobacterium longum subsp. infantis]
MKSFVAGVVVFCCVAFVNRRSQTNGLWLWFEIEYSHSLYGEAEK